MEYQILYDQRQETFGNIWKITLKKNENNTATIITEYGKENSKLKKYIKEIKEFPYNSKKGITNAYLFAKDIIDKAYQKKIKEGYSYNQVSGIQKELSKSNRSTPTKNNKSNKNTPSSKHSIKSKNDKLLNSNNKEEKINSKSKCALNKTSILRNDIFSEEEIKNIPKSNINYNKAYYPMLAYEYNKKSKYIKFPCNVQPKLDGVRCVALGNKLYSRNWNIFPGLDHIKNELSKYSEQLENIILDGELYTDDINFEKIVGLVRKNKKTNEELELTKKIYLNVFDCIDETLTFSSRYTILSNLFYNNTFEHLRLVKTEICYKKDEVNNYLDKYINEGYEGLILRNMKGKYQENLRSVELQKLKKFKDEEFEIIGYTTPDEGREVGCVIWKCVAKNGKTFTVKPKGSLQDRKSLYKIGKNMIGKMLTVKYQELTNDGLPRFPIGIGIRDYE